MKKLELPVLAVIPTERTARVEGPPHLSLHSFAHANPRSGQARALAPASHRELAPASEIGRDFSPGITTPGIGPGFSPRDTLPRIRPSA
jgi:hypothetical protein